MEELLQNLRYAFRTLVRRPAFTAVAILSLALGIGANSAIFTLIQAVFLHPLPVADPSALVSVYTLMEGVSAFLPVSAPNYADFRDRATTFSGVAAYSPVQLSLEKGEEPEILPGQMVSGNYFEVLGVRPALGRVFGPDEQSMETAPPVVVLGHGLWQRSFASDPEIVGRVIRLNAQPWTVIGVAPPGFSGTGSLTAADFWVPLGRHEQVMERRVRAFFDQRRATLLSVIARLKPGASLAAARPEMEGLAARLAEEYPDANANRSVELIPLAQSMVSPNDRDLYVRVGGLLAVMVGLVLLIACANVANMLLVQASGRRREVAVRLALGAGRGRLVRQLLTESLVLSVIAGAAGLLLASWLLGLAVRLAADYLPRALDLGLDTRVLLFTLALSLLTGVLFGLVPALQASRPALVPALKSEAGVAAAAGRRFGLREILVVVQVAFCLVALIGAALFLLSVRNAQKIDPGFARERLLVVPLDLDTRGYDEARGSAMFQQIVERMQALPGVRSAAVAESLLLVDSGLRRTVELEGSQAPMEGPIVIQTNAVGPGYFATLGIPLLQGRDIAPQDRPDSLMVAVINQTMAESLWPGQSPLGRRFLMKPTNEALEVVGVVADSKYNTLGEEPQLYVFRPLVQSYTAEATLHLRTERDPEQIAGAVRQTLRQIDPQLPVPEVVSMSTIMGRVLWAPRAAAALLGLFGAVALFLAAIGIYGVISYAVTQRRREVGIRMALGAERAQVIQLFLTRGMTLVIAGIGVGLLAAFALARLVESLLFGVEARNLPAFTATAVTLALIAILACFFPARRATAIPPQIVMRQE